MDISLRSVLTAGVTAATASALVVAPSVAPPPLTDITVPSVSADVAPMNWASDLTDAVYGVSRYWANYVALDLAPWVLDWIPYGWLASDQIYIWYQPFVLATTDAFVYQWLDPVLNNPLSAAAWINGINATGSAAVNGIVDGLVNEVYWAWGLLPFPPLPPCPSVICNLAAASPSVAAAGPIGNAVIDASQALADVSNAIWDVWNPIRDSIDYGVGVTSDVLTSLSWVPFVSVADFELTQTWNLIAREGDALTGFAHDMINAGDQAVADFFNLGLLAAADNAFWNTVNSVDARGSEAVDAVADYALDQLDYFTGIYVPHSTPSVATPSAPAAAAEAPTSLATAEGDMLEATLVVTPDAVTKSASEVPASVVASLDAPKVAGPAADDVAAQTPSASSDEPEDAGQAAETADEQGAAAEEAGAEKAAKAEAVKAAKAAADKAAKKAKKDSESAKATNTKTEAGDSDGAAQNDPSGPATKDSAAKQDSAPKKDKAAA